MRCTTKVFHSVIGAIAHFAMLALGVVRCYQVFHNYGDVDNMCAVPPWYMTDRCMFRTRLAIATVCAPPWTMCSQAFFCLSFLLHMGLIVVLACRWKMTF